jgi:hypothetical protein
MTKAEMDARLQLIVDNRILHHRALVIDRIEPQIVDKIETPLEQAVKQIKERLAKSDFTEPWEREWHKKTAQWLQGLTEEVYWKSSKELSKDLADFVNEEIEVYTDILSFDGKVENFQPVGLSRAGLKALVDTPVGGFLLEEWMQRQGYDLASAVQREIVTGRLLGEDYGQLVKRLEAVGISKRSEAVTLARTYVASINNVAHKAVHDANRDIMNGKMWYSTFDNRTCMVCAALSGRQYFYDGNIPEGGYSIDEAPPAPIHPRCRCGYLDITKSYSELLGITSERSLEKIEEEYHPFSIRGFYGEGKKKIPYPVDVGGAEILEAGRFKGTFEQWLKKYPEAALDILGPKRYTLWKFGEIKLSDMVEVTGGKAKILPIKQLKSEFRKALEEMVQKVKKQIEKK